MSRAIGFVEMATEEEARRATDQFNGKELAGRIILVSEGA
jgi:RNA recognition motif-containing protein